MANVIAIHEFLSPTGEVHGDLYCWLCQRASSSRALFCHHCGTIQPVRDIDHFARLGLERRIDVNVEAMEQNYTTLRRTLDPHRFAVRGMGERSHALRQREALDVAVETLRDPLRRGRYWLVLHTDGLADDKASDPVVSELRRELDSAVEPAQCDRVAAKAGMAFEARILSLLQSLRGRDWRQANAILAEIDHLESILSVVRSRRAGLMPDTDGGSSLASVK